MIERNERGFEFTKFKDRYGAICSLQKSSLATEDAIWFGIDDVNPIIMTNDAIKLGIPTNETCGWIKYWIPKEVQLNARMHLTREQVALLLPYFKNFVETGELSKD